MENIVILSFYMQLEFESGLRLDMLELILFTTHLSM